MDLPFLVKRIAPAALAAVFAIVPLVGASPASAQTAAGSVSGRVVSADGAPVGGAAVTLQGAASQETTTDPRGGFTFASVAPGAYTLLVTKAGFAPTQQEDVFVVAGTATTVSATLSPSSFSSLQTIGRVSANVPGRATINTTPASVAVLSQQVFLDQTQVQVTKVLNETPGIITTLGGYNNTSLGSPQVTQIRGALPYETESLIDGHPVSVSSDGSFSPTFLNPALLQNVEVVKGPGSSTTEINYAINGSVNYRTLEPTRRPQQTLEYGVDAFGGQFASVQATGSTRSHVLDYAFAAATDGTPSALHNYSVAGSAVPLIYGAPPWTVNGQVVAQLPVGFGASGVPQFFGAPGTVQYNEPVYTCCANVSAGYNSRSELAKIRLNFSQQTALTLSYLGGQSFFDDPFQQSSLVGIGGTNSTLSAFTPPPGYTGSVPAGRPIPFDFLAFSNLYDAQQQNLVQAEFRTTAGPSNSILARFYSAYTNDYSYTATGKAGSASYAFTANAWGGLLLCPTGTAENADGSCGGAGGGPTTAPVMTYFNGTPVVFGSTPVASTTQNQDHLRGYSVELDHTSGPNTYSFSFDRSHHDATQYADAALSGIVGFQLFPGSGQTFTTASLRGQLTLSPTLTLSLGDYAVQYASHYTDDGGLTWHDATHTLNAPRAGLAWRPSPNLAVRFSAGESVAPPFINILSSPGGNPVPDVTGGATSYTLNQNNGNIAPETAFAYDLGADKRLDRVTTLSADVYLTSLHNLFLPTTFRSGTYTPPSGADAGNTEPLYITQTANLGQARYEGLELAVQRTPPLGFGFRAQGSLMRAFTYSLPPGFYDTASGPYTTNLGVIPNVNFMGTGSAGNGAFFNGLPGGRIPYAIGYGEANWRTRAGTYYNLGITYFGPNNAFNLPAFAVVSGTARFTLAKNTTLTISGDNLLGAYNEPFGYYLNGIPVPLANGQYAHSSSGYLGVTRGSNYGPSTVRLAIRHRFGAE